MIRLFLRLFVRDYQNTTDKKVRERYGILSGILGIFCNLFLFLLKFTVGTLMKSIAITSDAFNNLSDIGTSVVSVIGAKMSNKRPDNKHPFGHGRIEYIASLIVSFLIMTVGIELFKESFGKILHPQEVEFFPTGMILLAASVLVKVWMYLYNRYLGRQISSPLLLATAKDSINDVISTSAVLLSTLLGLFLPFSIDGYIGILVSLLILYSGFDLGKETVGVLLGQPPESETVERISEIVLSGSHIVGIHDLIVHNYGPGRSMASVHAEVSCEDDVIAVHEEIDALEQKVASEMDIVLVIHMDPILTSSEEVNRLKEMTAAICTAVDKRFSIHDFRITDGEERINLIFDLVVPHEFRDKEQEQAVDTICRRLRQLDDKYRAVINIDKPYV